MLKSCRSMWSNSVFLVLVKWNSTQGSVLNSNEEQQFLIERILFIIGLSADFMVIQTHLFKT